MSNGNNTLDKVMQQNGAPVAMNGGKKPAAIRKEELSFYEGDYEGSVGTIQYFNEETMKHDPEGPYFWIRFPGKDGKAVYMPQFENLEIAKKFAEFIVLGYEVTEGVKLRNKESKETKMDAAAVAAAKKALSRFKE